MLDLGYSNAKKRAFEELLFSNHKVFVRIQILDLDHKYISDVSRRLIAGQVDFDADADITQTLSITLFDPHNEMDITTDSPNDGAAFMDRQVKVTYCIAPPDESVWYECPLFCGPMTKVDRQDDAVNIECAGKEFLLAVSVYTPATYKKGKRKTDVVVDLLRDYGEQRYSVKASTSTLPKDLAVSHQSVPWTVIKSVVNTLGQMIFYDGRGYAIMRRRPSSAVFTFGKNMITSKPQIGFSTDKLINAARVVGAKPKGKNKTPVSFKMRAASSHPLSPYALGRTVGGVRKPRDYMANIEDESLKTVAACKAVAEERVRVGLIEGVEVAFESLVVPHLQINDVFKVHTDDFAVDARFRKASFSLTSAKATYGYTKNLSPQKAKIRRFKK